jgi:hypothetical protein
MKAPSGNEVATPDSGPALEPKSARRARGKRTRNGKRAKGPASSAALWGLKGFKRVDLDARNLWAVRFRRHVGELLSGVPQATPAAIMLARRAAGLALQCEAMEAVLASGKSLPDPTAYTRASATLSNLLHRLCPPASGRRGNVPPSPADAHARAILDLLPDTHDAPEPAQRAPQGEADATQTEEDPTL